MAGLEGDDSEWRLIIASCPRAEAELRFKRWLEEQEEHGAPVDLRQIKKDLIAMGPGSGGCHVQYWLRKGKP